MSTWSKFREILAPMLMPVLRAVLSLWAYFPFGNVEL